MASEFRYRLLFVGINAVPDGAPLQAAGRDAEALSARFTGWGLADPASHRLLLGGGATAERIHEELDGLASARLLDLCLIYWAGHMTAGRRHTLATPDDGAGAPVTLESLTDALTASTARHRMLVLDAVNGGTGALPLRRLSRVVPTDACTTILASTSSCTRSREHPRRGYLTGALLEQLAIASRTRSPTGDLVDVIRATASAMSAKLDQPPVFGVYGTSSPLRLPSVGPDGAVRHVHAA